MSKNAPTTVGSNCDPRPGLDLLERFFEREGRSIGPVAGHGVERIGDREHPRRQRDLLPRQPGGVPGAVPPFVVGAHDLDGALQEPDGLHDRCPDRGVAPHDVPFVVGEGAGLAQYRFGDADLADVVQEEPVGNLGLQRQLRVDPSGKGQSVALGAIQVSARAAVLRLDDLGERGHGRDVHLAHVLQGCFELAGAEAFGFVQPAQLTGEHGELGVDGGKFGVSVRPLPARRMGNASDGHVSPRSGKSASLWPVAPLCTIARASDSRRVARPRCA